MTRQRWGWLLAMCGLLALGCGKSGPDTDPRDGDDDAPFEPWEEVLEDTEAYVGFLTLHRKRDATVYLEIPESRLDTDFGMTLHIGRGAGVFNVHQGLPLTDARLMRLRRVGDKVLLE